MSEAILRYRKDPVKWVRDVLGNEPWDMQAQVLEAIRDNRRTAVASCHAAGKSFIGARAALWFLNNFPKSVVVTTAPTARQVEGILWKEIRSAHQKAKFPLGGQVLSTQIKMKEDWFAWGFTTKDYDESRFQGFHAPHILVIVDEAAGISDQIFVGIDALLSGGHARLLLIGNPTNPLSYFARQFKQPGVKQFYISAFDTPNFTKWGITEDDIRSGDWEKKVAGKEAVPGLITPEWVAEKFHDWGPTNPVYLARIKAQFPTDSKDALIPWSWIVAAQQRELNKEGSRRITADISAGRGGDDSTIGVSIGPWFRLLEVDNGFELMQLVGKIKRHAKEYNAEEIRVDPIGVGAGVGSRLRELGQNVVEVHSGTGANDPELFANTRAEMYWHLRALFESGDMDIDADDADLAAQLAALRYKMRSNGQILMESKQDMLSRGVKSPDRADTLAMAHAEVDVDSDPGFLVV